MEAKPQEQDKAPNTDLEDTREFTDAELMELGLLIEFFRKHPEIKVRCFQIADEGTVQS